MARTTQTNRKKPATPAKRPAKRPAGHAPDTAPDPVSVSNVDLMPSGGASEYVYTNSLDPDPATLSDEELVKRTLRLIMLDPMAPAAAKAQAARTLAEMAQALGRDRKPAPDASKPVAELTMAEIEAELAALAGE